MFVFSKPVWESADDPSKKKAVNVPDAQIARYLTKDWTFIAAIAQSFLSSLRAELETQDSRPETF
jgi:hypothetical protein